MKKLAKILVILLVMTLAISCFVACGETPCKHTYLDNYTCHDRVCTLCGKVSTSSTEHNYETGICACGEVDATYYTEGLEFKLVGEATYEVVGFIGDDTKVTIPSEYGGLSVTQISDEAFTFGANIEEINISESITSVSQTCFEPCMSLQRIEVHKDNHHYKDIDGNMYDKEGKRLIHYARGKNDKSFSIPDTVTSINRYAFAFSDNLEEVCIPNAVTEIGEGAFYMCLSLKKVEFKENSMLKSIGKEAFFNCKALTSIYIPNSVINVAEDVFEGCKPVIYCEAEDEPDTWSDRWSGSGVIVWDCKNNDVTANGYAYTHIDGTRYALKDGVARATIMNSQVDANVLPSITYKGDEYPVESVYISDYMLSLENLFVPSTVRHINQGVQYGDIFYVVYSDAKSKPDSWSNDWNDQIVRPVVWDCKNNDVADDGYIYVTVDGIRYGIKDGVAEVVMGRYGIVTADIKSSIVYKDVSYPVTTIRADAFWSRIELKKVVIPDSIVTINKGFYGAFESAGHAIIYCEAESQPSGWDSSWNNSNCPVVWDYKNNDIATDGYIYAIEDGVKYGIKDGVATVVNQVQDSATIKIREKITYKGTHYPVTSIVGGAFFSVTFATLENIFIPKSVTEIGDYAFLFALNLSNISVSKDNPAYKSIDGNLYTKDEKVLVQYAVGKSDESFDIPNGVEKIGDYAFYYCFPIKHVTIPNTVTTIGASAFECYGSNIEYMVIPKSVVLLETQAFVDTNFPIYFEAESGPAGLLGDVRCYWYSETEPTEDGRYWHYVDGVPTVW